MKSAYRKCPVAFVYIITSMTTDDILCEGFEGLAHFIDAEIPSSPLAVVSVG